ncbi:hypothetical protein B0H11DRAFT_2267415 [Mycena galericulata]|nr:hypothetical protein B0H11DRAFT_2267415 [Mycena galericulata]
MLSWARSHSLQKQMFAYSYSPSLLGSSPLLGQRFLVASSLDNESYVKNSELYIYPQLMSDWLGESTVESGTGTGTLNPYMEALTKSTAWTAPGTA